MFIMDFRHKKLSDVYLLMIHVSSRIVFERNSSPDTVTVVVRRETWDGSRRTKRPGDYLYHTTSVRKEIPPFLLYQLRRSGQLAARRCWRE
jgi:hypothetical protein